MPDPIISPDGKWMWTGTEWIPVPPSGKSVSQNHDITNAEILGQISQSSEGGDNNNQKINLQDVNIHKGVKQTAISEGSSSQELKVSDTVIMGDLTQNTTINNSLDFIVSVLERLGISPQSSPSELTPSQEVEVEQVLEMSEQLTSHGIEIDPWTEITLGNAAELAGQTNTSQQHYLRALETFRKNGDREGEGASLTNLGIIAQTRGDLVEAERLHRESLDIRREIGDRKGEGASLLNLGNIAETRGDLVEAERLYRESLAIDREIGDRNGEATSLRNLGDIAKERGDIAEAERLYRESLAIDREIGDRKGEGICLECIGDLAFNNGNMDESHRYYTEAVQIYREIGVPIQQWFIDNGY
jgi:tetratricopeptide (TPR) repeat protein